VRNFKRKIQHDTRRGEEKKRQPPDYAFVRSTVWEQEKKNTSATLAHNQYTLVNGQGPL